MREVLKKYNNELSIVNAVLKRKNKQGVSDHDLLAKHEKLDVKIKNIRPMICIYEVISNFWRFFSITFIPIRCSFLTCWKTSKIMCSLSNLEQCYTIRLLETDAHIPIITLWIH